MNGPDSRRGTSGEAARGPAGQRDGELLAPLLPAGEPVEGLDPDPGLPASVGPNGPTSKTIFRGDDGRVHFNLLGWDGRGSAPHLFPGGQA